MTYKFTKEQIQSAIETTRESNGTISMRAAGNTLGIKYDTFKKYAQMYGLWNPNLFGIGRKKTIPVNRSIPLDDILAGNQPQYNTLKLKKRLFSELLWPKICSSCSLTTWLDREIPLELDHIDGNRFNHRLENLRVLCPNCHAQTDTYCGKNKGSYNMVCEVGVEPT